jgi:hypothetical protein
MCCNLGRLVRLHCSSFNFAKRWHFVVCFNVSLMSIVSSVTLAPNVLRLGEGGVLPLNFNMKHTLQIYEKLSYEAQNRHFCQTAVISCPSVRPKCCRSCLQGLSAMNGCGCLHSLLLLLRLPVR